MRLVLAAALAAVMTSAGITAAAAAPEEDAVMQPVAKFAAALNAGDEKAAEAAMTPSQTITDEFAPYHWQGPKALSMWFAGDAADMKTHGVTDAAVELGKPLHVFVSGDYAYAAVPMTYRYAEHGKKTVETAIFTMSLVKTGDRWLIGSWAYALQ